MNELERQKLDALKELAYGASHEINNPLANIAARAQTLLRDEVHPERRRALEAIHQQALRAHEMIADLMLFAPAAAVGDRAGGSRSTGPRCGAESHCRGSRAQIEFRLVLPDEPFEVQADGEQLTVAIKAVCVNAVEAIGREGQVSITVRQEKFAGEERAVIEIADTGPGISAEIREHIFDPFFSGREAGRGLGFGLSKCWRIVTEHGGDVEVDSEAGQGAKFRICFEPRHDVILRARSSSFWPIGSWFYLHTHMVACARVTQIPRSCEPPFGMTHVHELSVGLSLLIPCRELLHPILNLRGGELHYRLVGLIVARGAFRF